MSLISTFPSADVSSITSKVNDDKVLSTKLDCKRNAEPIDAPNNVNEIEESNNEEQPLKLEKNIVALSDIMHQRKPTREIDQHKKEKKNNKVVILSDSTDEQQRNKDDKKSFNYWIRQVASFFTGQNSKDISHKYAEKSAVHLEIPEAVPVVQSSRCLLPSSTDPSKKCLVLDLDETLVHSFPCYTPFADFVISIELEEGIFHPIYVVKRPGVDEFLKVLAERYEIVVFTASLSKYANPLLDRLDPTHTLIKHRLFREHCVHYCNTYVKDLSLLNRPLSQTLIVDNSPVAYSFHYKNALPCSSFYDNLSDTELYEIMAFLKDVEHVDDIRKSLGKWRKQMNYY